MKKIIILIFSLYWFPIMSQNQISTRAKYSFTVPELIPKDSVFVKKLYNKLQELSQCEKSLFENLNYFTVKIIKDIKQEITIEIEGGVTPSMIIPTGYVMYHDKLFMFSGSIITDFFREGTGKRSFKGDVPINFDDHVLLWILKYKHNDWTPIEYPDLHYEYYDQEKEKYNKH